MQDLENKDVFRIVVSLLHGQGQREFIGDEIDNVLQNETGMQWYDPEDNSMWCYPWSSVQNVYVEFKKDE